MNSTETTNASFGDTLSKVVQRMTVGGYLIGSGVLIGLGALALVRGLHLYIHFYSYATGIETSRLYQTLIWSLAGGIVLSLGVFTLVKSLSHNP